MQNEDEAPEQESQTPGATNEAPQSSGENLPAKQDPSREVASGNQKGSILMVHDIENEQMPDLYDQQQFSTNPLDLASQYWNPEVEGESRRLLFSHYQTSLVPDNFGPGKDQDPKPLVELETAFFYERKAGTEIITTVRQASKGLIVALKSAGIKPGTLLEIVYLKLQRFKSGNVGQTWGIYPIKALPKKEPAT